MATRSTQTFHFDFPPERLMEVLTDPDFHKANLLNQGHPDASVRVASRTDDRVALEADVTEYAKGITGVDKSKTELTRTEWDWDLNNRKADWIYHHPQGARVKVWGQIRVEGAGDGSRLTEEFNCQIKVPLVGGKIEKMVLKEVDAYWPKYEALVREHCEKKK